MNKLRLTPEEKDLLIEAIRNKLEQKHKGDITSFTYEKKDVQEFLKKLTEEEVKKPTILIDSVTYTKMYELVKQSTIEIQWHMMVERNIEEQTYYVYDVLLFPQTNSGTSTTTDQDEFAKWQMNLISNPEFPIENLRGHGHSHVNMNVYSSGIDDAYQEDLVTKVEDGDYYLFFVLNKRMEMFALLYDFNQQILFETKDMDIKITADHLDIKEWCKEQISMYCKSYTPKYRIPTTYQYPGTMRMDTQKPKEAELIAEIKEAQRRYEKGKKKK